MPRAQNLDPLAGGGCRGAMFHRRKFEVCVFLVRLRWVLAKWESEIRDFQEGESCVAQWLIGRNPKSFNFLSADVWMGWNQIYQLGDSISDTGNLIREKPVGSATQFARLPYGETYFNRTTGRCSNGRLMIDFIANSSGLPFLSPYKKTDGDFAQGVNYAVAGATALPTEVLAKKHIPTMGTNSPLNVQLDWMSTHLNSICTPETDCLEKLKNSLFMVGEIGGNDYNFALLNGEGIDEVQSLVPEVVEAIISTVRQVIGYGAARVVVPGNFPIGCFPIYLTTFQTNNSNAYDEHHCLKELNSFSKYHNDQLQEAIQQLEREYRM